MHRRRIDRHTCGRSPRLRTAGVVPATASCYAKAARELAAHRPGHRNSLGRRGRRHLRSLSPRFVRTRYELITCWSKDDESFRFAADTAAATAKDGARQQSFAAAQEQLTAFR